MAEAGLHTPVLELQHGSAWGETLPAPVFSFVTGAAGTGKTHLVRAQAAQPASGITLCATTGIAAINLGEGITTINSLLQYFDTASLRDKWVGGYLSVQLQRLYQAGVSELCIDEVSMMDGHQLVLLFEAITDMNADLERQGKEPMRLRLTGDFCQLPPVKAPFAFEMPCWKEFEAHTVVLRDNFRQSDTDFLEALRNARGGDGNRAADYFASFCQRDLDPEFLGTTIMARNEAVNRFNQLRFHGIPQAVVELRATAWGTTRTEWKEIPPVLQLKKGALVMILANKREDDDEIESRGPRNYDYVNGDLGIVEDFDTSKLGSEATPVPWVRLRRNSKVLPILPIVRDNKIPLEPGRRKALKAAGQEHRIKDRYEIIGEIRYTPLRLAYATTCHKSQGLTLEEVQIDIRDRFFSSPGMAYVALSRVRRPDGLRLVGQKASLTMKFAVDNRVRRWL